ncbi:hypothetical protein PT974_02565 [Cladobotryum mycophilum]|uniref:Uncharacterized protein n=1 Tax=Cladobotryum mycophilum TaxID=491253 RepID=A0ABR0SYG7_9HYPO
MAHVDLSPPVDDCCTRCCKAADFGNHDYCLPCETNPACSSLTKTKDSGSHGGKDIKGNDQVTRSSK